MTTLAALPLSRRVPSCAPSPTLAIIAKANQMKVNGLDVIAFGTGEPDFDTPEHIKQAAIDALGKGFTKHTPSAGILALKKVICKKFQKNNGLPTSPIRSAFHAPYHHSDANLLDALIGFCLFGIPGGYIAVIRQFPQWTFLHDKVPLSDREDYNASA